MREVIFTPEPLESKCFSDFQLAQNRQANMRTAQGNADEELLQSVGQQTRGPAWPNITIFNRVFRDIKRLGPNALITFDFMCYMTSNTFDVALPLNADVLVAAVVAGVAIDTLTLVFQSTHWFINIMNYLESELTASIRSLRKFHLDQLCPGNDYYHGQSIITLLGSAQNVRELIVCLTPFYSVTVETLRANDFSQLTTVHLKGAVLPSKNLVKALSHRRLMLHTHLSHVKLVGSEEAWPDVFRTLKSLSQLHQLSLSVLQDHSLRIGRLVFSGLTHGKVRHDGRVIRYKGEAQIATGLNELEEIYLPKVYDDDARVSIIFFDKGTIYHICLMTWSK